MSYFQKLQALQSQREAAMRQGKQEVDEVAGSAYQRNVEKYNDKLESLKKPYERFRTTMEDVAGITGGISAVGKAAKKLRDARAAKVAAKETPTETPTQTDVNSPPDTVTRETGLSPEGASRPVTSSDSSAPLSSEQTGATSQADSGAADASTTTEASAARPVAQAAEASEGSAFDVGTTIPRNTPSSVLSDYRAAGDEPFSAPRTISREINVNNNVSTDLHTAPTAADVQNSGASVSDISDASRAVTGAETSAAIAPVSEEASAGVLSTAAEVGSTVLEGVPVLGELAMVGSLLAALFTGKKEASATSKIQKPPTPVAPQIVQAGFDAQQTK